MANYPEFEGSDGVYRQHLVLTTTIRNRFFVGIMPLDTVDMRVSIQGGPFTSDPDYISFEGNHFTIPNPSAFPEGIELLPGQNIFRVQSVLTTGAVTQEASAQVQLSLESDLGGIATPPTGIFLERFDSTVRVTVEGVSSNQVVGYHFYASPQAGGGTSGYYRINPALVVSGEAVEAYADIGLLSVDANVALNSEGLPQSDPLFFHLVGTQEDENGFVWASDFNETLEVPETATRFRVSTSVQTIRETFQYHFVHDRQATLSSANPALPHSVLAAVPATDPLYYVATAVYVLSDGTEVESPFSPEVLGSNLRIAPNVGAFPQVSRQQILRNAVQSIYRSNPQVRVDPGSALRDTFLDPFTTEADRIRFLVDFLHNSQSFATLLVVDDPTLSGVSIPVSQSGYKVALREAFHLTTDSDVQTIIDNCFDKLASNYGVLRDGGQRARGEVTFYVNTRPGSTITKAIGTLVSSGGVNFRTTSTAVISPTGGGRNFNPTTGRYFAKAYVQAESNGSAGNLAAGQVRVIAGNGLGVQVLNESPTFGGTDRESNRDLATRAMRVLSSVDSGTLQGYVNNATNVPGVEQIAVIQAGHPLMMRDRTEDGRHLGGKVDVYVRGQSPARITDVFAFAFDVGDRIQFEPVGDPSNLRFRAIDPRLTLENPIIEMLDIPSLGLGLENISQGYLFDLRDVVLDTYNQIVLSPVYNDPTRHTLGDQFTGSYRYRTSSRFVPTRQPVVEVNSFSGTRTGTLVEGIYDLYRSSDPLSLGRSTLADDYIQVTEPLDNQGTTIPSGDPIVVSGEEHIFLGGVEYLGNLGANYLTVRVWNENRTVEYNGPLSTNSQDYTLVFGSEQVPLGLQLTDGSRISEGQRVLIDYSHDENFTLVYTSNAVVSVVQNDLNADSHITADVVAKWAIPQPVDLAATIALERNQNMSQVDGRVRTALAQLFGTFEMGTPIRQSDVIRAIDAVPGVSYVVTPLTKMVLSPGALVIREPLTITQASDVFHVQAWSSATVSVYLLKDTLSSATLNAGGNRTEFRGVFKDESLLGQNETPPNFNGFPLRGSAGGAFIIGNDGLVIPGFSDDGTIESNNVLPSNPDEKASAILRLRKGLTANRVLVSLDPNENPESSQYAVTYQVGEDTGVKNLEPGPLSYLVLGDMTFIYDEAR